MIKLGYISQVSYLMSNHLLQFPSTLPKAPLYESVLHWHQHSVHSVATRNGATESANVATWAATPWGLGCASITFDKTCKMTMLLRQTIILIVTYLGFTNIKIYC